MKIKVGRKSKLMYKFFLLPLRNQFMLTTFWIFFLVDFVMVDTLKRVKYLNALEIKRTKSNFMNNLFVWKIWCSKALQYIQEYENDKKYNVYKLRH